MTLIVLLIAIGAALMFVAWRNRFDAKATMVAVLAFAGAVGAAILALFQSGGTPTP